jgi:hypothetical protein
MRKFGKYLLGACLLGGATAASAGDLTHDIPQNVAENVMATCRADYHRLCPDVVPGGGRAAMCLLDHAAELAPFCLRAVKIAHAIGVCASDYRLYCEGIVTGARSFECLAARLDDLRPACRRVVTANLPYMFRDGRRFAYGRPSPYGAPYPDPYAFRGPAGVDPYAAETPEESPYRTSPYATPYERRGPNGAYAYGGREIYPGPGAQEPYGDAEPRFRSYDEHNVRPRVFGGDEEGAPGEREMPEEEKE